LENSLIALHSILEYFLFPMNSLLESILPPIDGIHTDQEPDGTFTVSHGSATVTFSPLEMAQVERGLVSVETARASIVAIMGISESMEEALGSQRQRREYKQSQHISLN
jgi:hypothetical protein